MTDRPLSEREGEILMFLLSAPAIPDSDLLRRQAVVATSTGHDCPCGCASIGLKVDPAAAPRARPDLRRALLSADTDGLASVHEREPLAFEGDDGLFDPAVQPTDDDLKGGSIGLILWVDDGWLSGIEITGVGLREFKFPATFPPAECFAAPYVIEVE